MAAPAGGGAAPAAAGAKNVGSIKLPEIDALTITGIAGRLHALSACRQCKPRLGSPASPRIVPVDAAACRAYRDPGGTNAPKSYTHAQRARAMKLVSELKGYRKHMTQDQEQRFMRALSRFLTPGSRGSSMLSQMTPRILLPVDSFGVVTNSRELQHAVLLCY